MTYRYEENGASEAEATIGANGAYSWYYIGEMEEGIAFEKYNGLTLYYTIENHNWEYQYAFEYDKNSSLYSMDLTNQFGMFLQAYDFGDSLKKAKSGKVAGRDCEVYTFSVSAKGQIVQSLVGVDATWSYYIDKETGICLKFEVSGDDGESHNQATFEVTEFKTNAMISGLKHPTDVYPINGKDPNLTGNWNWLDFVGLKNIMLSKDNLVSNEDFYSTENLGIGQAIYFFKVEDVTDLDSGFSYMSTYYEAVVSEIKKVSDDNKCYTSESMDELEEATSSLEDSSLIYGFLFKYHEELYVISFMLDDYTEYDVNSFLLVIDINKANE